jgi:hypothetical protein
MPIDCKLLCKSEQVNMENILIQLNKIKDSKPNRYEDNEEENELLLKYEHASTDLTTCLRDCKQREDDGKRGQGGRNRKYIRKTKSRSSRTRRTNYRKKTTRWRQRR